MNASLAVALVCLAPLAAAQDAEPPTVVATLVAEGERVAPLQHSDVARDFAASATRLPPAEARTLQRDPETRRYLTAAERAALDDAARDALEPVELPPERYYTTKYGTPIAYVRVVELMGRHGVTSLEGKRVADFGYGTIGHLRMMASLGADVVGIDVDPFLPALYDEPGDLGVVANPDGADGRTAIVTGRWPASPEILDEVGAGFDVFTSKNTLKRGYIHPAREADPRMLIDLGVDDATFLASLHACLNPGGLAILYNICPPQNPDDEPYIPWADGESPFTREQWEAAGFEVLELSVVDHGPTRELATALGWGDSMDVESGLFAWYTVARKVSATR